MAFHHSPKIVTNGLVLCLDAANRKSYSGTGTVWRDLAGSNNGTLTNGPTFGSANGGSIVLDGTNDYVNIGDNTSLRFGTGNFAWGVWVKTVNTNTLASIIGKRSNTDPFAMNFISFGTLVVSGFGFTGNASKRINFGLRFNNSNQYVGNSNNDIIDGNWKYIVMVRNSGSLQLYSNGVNQNFTLIHNSGTGINTDISLTGTNRFIGATTDGVGATSFLNGDIAYVHMYNRALTPAEILQNYNATKGRFNL